MPFYAGQGAGAIHEVLPAAEIVAELASGIPNSSITPIEMVQIKIVESMTLPYVGSVRIEE